jgi:hypothetical protein
MERLFQTEQHQMANLSLQEFLLLASHFLLEPIIQSILKENL